MSKGVNDMNSYNFIKPENSVAPNYDVHDKDTYFCIFVSHQEEVCIVGQVDNNYISWCSLTNISEKEINIDIINFLLGPRERIYSTEYKALGFRYRDVMKWHKFIVKSELFNNEYRYRSPVSSCFFGDPSHNNGIFLANEIKEFYLKELSKCQYRLIDDVYITVLNRYKSLLMKERSPAYYHQMLSVIAILESESYLKLCLNEEVRRLYWECLELCSSLYSAYMTASR